MQNVFEIFVCIMTKKNSKHHLVLAVFIINDYPKKLTMRRYLRTRRFAR